MFCFVPLKHTMKYFVISAALLFQLCFSFENEDKILAKSGVGGKSIIKAEGASFHISGTKINIVGEQTNIESNVNSENARIDGNTVKVAGGLQNLKGEQNVLANLGSPNAVVKDSSVQ